MCGIVGMVTSKDHGFISSEQRIFSQLLWANTLRGNDSTGIFGVNKYGNLDYVKTKGHAGTLMSSREYKEFDDNIFSDYHMVVGHNRKATKGWVNDENAHPFVEGNLALVHNGTLTNHHSLTKETVEVDSHAILHSIVERGYEETLKDIQGAFTLAWYDSNDKTLRVIRNDQRPLFIASTVGAWYFASEKGMLEWILGREQVTISEMEECTPGTLYSFKLEDKKNMWFQPMELYKPPKSTNVTYIPATRKEEEGSSKGKVYENGDFLIGTKILIQGEKLQQLKRQNNEGYDHIFLGKWFFDEEVLVRCWADTTEIDILEATMDDTVTDQEVMFQAEISVVMTKGNKVTLICKNLVPYVPCMDASNKEIFEDEFMFTNAKCSYCNTDMNFYQAAVGIFKYEAPDDFELICEHCLAAGKHITP